MDDYIYVTGHKNPDSDSIVSAIAYAFYKKTQGIKAKAVRLGELNPETKYLLKRFNFEEPELLTDARRCIKDIDIDAPDHVYEDDIVYDVIQKTRKLNKMSVGVVDKENRLVGYVTKSNLLNVGLGDTAEGIELLKHTSTKNIAKAINGQIIYDDDDFKINGKVSIIPYSSNATANYDIKERIVIIGDDTAEQLKCIEKGAGLLIVVWTRSIDQKVIELAKEKHCPIVISGHGAMNTSRYIFFAPSVSLIMTKDPVCFNHKTLIEDVSKKMMKTRFLSYPVIDDEKHLIGYIARYHIMGYKNKQLILVDHNEFSQSVKAVEKAEILEVVDHHRINDFKTNAPVSFRNEIVGSTATIVAMIFRENRVPFTKEMAGLLLGAIISDTLNFQSPTTTAKDRETAMMLSAIADLDTKDFARDIFNNHTSEKRIENLLVQDIKLYDFSGLKTMISQIFIDSYDEDELKYEMNRLVEKKGIDLLTVAVTDIMKEGSYLYFAGEYANIFKDKYKEGEFIKHLLSRKQQIVPEIEREINDTNL